MERERLLKQAGISEITTPKEKQMAAETAAKEDATCIVDTRLLEKLMEMSKEEEAKIWGKCCIYRIPWYVREMNPQAYTPKLISYGPYHHGSPHLAEMEIHKHRALAHVLKRTGKSFRDYVEALRPLTKSLRDSYRDLDEKWKDSPDKFLELMVMDGLFWLEMTRVFENKDDEEFESDYCENDPMFSSMASRLWDTNLLDDFGMLENQLPGFLTRTLARVSEQTREPGEWEKPEGIQGSNEKEPLHFLDQVRNLVIGSHRQSPERLTNFFYSATDLDSVGIVFKKNELSATSSFCGNLKITFDKVKGILAMSKILIIRETESMLLNMVAFEHLHLGKGHEISAYIVFIAFLLKTSKDVRLLREARLLSSDGADEEKIAEYLQKLRHEMGFSPNTSYEEVRADINVYYEKNTRKWKKRIRKWWVYLKKTYFKNPWTFSSLVAAIVLLGLTGLRTNHSALAYSNAS